MDDIALATTGIINARNYNIGRWRYDRFTLHACWRS